MPTTIRSPRVIFVFGDCELDTQRYELRRGGVTCHVEPQVLDLLVHLVTNRDRLVTKDEIHETIWKGRVVSESSLSARISAARRVLGENGSEDGYIQTVFRRGFRFMGPVEIRNSPSEPARTRSERAASPVPAPPVDPSVPAYVCGAFACYSQALAPALEGKLVRSSLVIEPGSAASPAMKAVYSESLPSGRLRHRGTVGFSIRTLYMDLADAHARSRVFLTLLAPSPPATALLGVMSGRVFHAPNAEIAVTRLLAIRVPVPDPAVLDASNRYLDQSAGAVAGDLKALGLPLACAKLDSPLQAFLRGDGSAGIFRVTAEDNQAVNVELDRMLGAAGGADPARDEVGFTPARRVGRGPVRTTAG